MQATVGANTVPTWQVGLPASVPNTESVKEVMVAFTGPVLVTVKVKVTLPPVSGTLVGLADLAIVTRGRLLVNDTVAEPDALAGLFWASTTFTVAVFVCGVPGVPLKNCIKVKLQAAAGARVVPTRHPGPPASVPNTESVREVILAGTLPILVTVNVKVTFPPVWGTLVGLADLVIDTAGKTSVNVTVAVPVPITVLPKLSTAPTETVFVWGVPGEPVNVVV